MQRQGEPEIIFEKNLALITSPKVAQPATLMKSCSWLKRAIVSPTLCSLKTFPNLVKLLLSFQIFMAVQLTSPDFFTFHSFSLY